MLFGGVLPDIASAQVGAMMYDEAVDDYALATLHRPGGPVVTIETGYTYASRAPGGDFEWRVGAAGAYLVDRGDTFEVATLHDAAVRSLAPLPAAARYRAFMADTLQRLRDGRAPLVGFADYVRVMQLADHIYARAEVRA